MGKTATAELLFHLWKEVVEVVRGCQIKRILCMCDQLKFTFLYHSHGHCGCIGWSIVLEEHSPCHLSKLNPLDFLPFLCQEISVVGPGERVTVLQVIHP